jgi:RNA binding exosome subunit
MASKPGFLDYVSAAFSARPLGMFVAPNWIGLAAVGLLGVVNPGFWVIGAGLELAYLLTLSTNGRFQRLIDARQSVGAQSESLARKGDLLNQLPNEDKQRFAEFEHRAQSILALQRQTSATTLAGLEEQHAGLNRLAWMYLRLLSARRVIEHVLEDADVVDRQDLEAKRTLLQKQAKDETIDAEIRRSLASQIEILTQRIDRRAEAERKLGFLDAEIERLEQQVELIREQAALSTDPSQLSLRIDEITASLGTTSQWIRDQQQVFGAMDDLLSDAPPLTTKTSARELQ